MQRRKFFGMFSAGLAFLASSTSRAASGGTVASGYGVYVGDFGAVGDGVHDDTSAINAAIASLPAYGGRVLFGAGSYKITGPISILNSAVELVGAGREATRVLQVTVGADGIEFTSNTAGNSLAGNGSMKNTLTIRGMSILRSGTNGGVAVNATWASATDNGPYFYAEGVLIYGDNNAGNAWSEGMRLTNANGVRLTNVSIRGNPFETASSGAEPYTMEAALHLTGDTSFGHIDHFYTGLSGGYCNKFIKIDAWYEGIYMVNCEFVQVGFGVYVRGYTKSQNPVLYISNTHMDFRNSAVDAVNQYNLQIVNCNIFKSGGAPSPGIVSNAINLQNCQFFRAAAVDMTNTHAATSYGIVVDSISFGGNISGTKVRSFNQIGLLLNGSSGWIISGSSFDYCGTAIYLTATGNVIGHNNYTLNTSDVVDTNGGNIVQLRQWSGNLSSTFNTANVTQTITVSVPVGIFSSTPSAVFATENFYTGLQLIFCYDRIASSPTSLVLRVQQNGGAIIASGNSYSIAVAALQ